MFNRVKVRTLRCYRYLKVIFKSLAYLPYNIIKGDFYMKNIQYSCRGDFTGYRWEVESSDPLSFKERQKENVRIKTINVWYYTKDVNTAIT